MTQSPDKLARRSDRADTVLALPNAATVTLAIVGEFNPEFEPHQLTDAAIRHSAAHLGLTVSCEWIGTRELVNAAAQQLAAFDALWIAPGSPYAAMDGALDAIRYARESDVPLLGTCGGFQHVVIEFARNVLGWRDADSLEHGRESAHMVVVPTACFLVGQSFEVELAEGSRARRLYGRPSIEERYYCRYGLNPAIQGEMSRSGLRVTGIDTAGEARVLELEEHPFFIATLFVPQARSTAAAPHPVITAFLDTARR
jgi:CTP synthase (UTP-ammonia lyase)